MDPQEFILHLHVDRRENRTCHWGFDPAHWRTYLHLDEDAYRWEDERAEATRRLDEVKRRGTAHPKLKRKQVGTKAIDRFVMMEREIIIILRRNSSKFAN